MARYRTERDTLGAVRVPRNALWGAQTARAVENFPVSGLRADQALIRAYVMLKKAAAIANFAGGWLPEDLARAINRACDDILGGQEPSFDLLVSVSRARGRVKVSGRSGRRTADLDSGPAPLRHLEQFPVDVFQAGAGTSFNMNCNEVIANLANQSLGGKLGHWRPIHPNDHVNMSQSTNDTFPTATRLAVLLVAPGLLDALGSLSSALMRKAASFDSVIKPGRTHLQDAVPVTLGREVRGWAHAVDRSTRLLEGAIDELRDLGIGGTATGTGINTAPGYRRNVVRLLRAHAGLDVRESGDLHESMQSQLPITAVSSALRNAAVELGRIASDLRLLSSGPTTGLAEIELPPVQPGSSIMPGKVNPSLAECLNQICYRVMGADATIAAAAGAGQLELNVMMPIMASELLFSIGILASFLPVFTSKCVEGIVADRQRCRTYVESSPALATFLNPLIGYEKAAELAKESLRTGRTIPDLIKETGLLSSREIKRVFGTKNLTGHLGDRATRL